MKKHLILSNLAFLDHGVPSHPENANRLKAILSRLEESPYHQYLDLSVDRLATIEELSQVHEPSYIQQVLSLDGKNGSLDDETFLTSGSVKAARMAAGMGIELVERVLQGKIKNGFALLRPPGHHSRPSAGMGFCIFNNIAIATKKALETGLKRVLILDWDVHHGNGTEEMFYSDDRVLLIDLHQDNLFPVGSGLLNERGSGKGFGFTVNIPLPASSKDGDYLYTFDKIVRPLALEYVPELILVSAGFDAHESDPLGFMNVTTEGFGLLAAKVKALAEEVCGGKLAFFLEGGYDSHCLAKNVLECIGVLIEEKTSSKETNLSPSKEVETLIKEIYTSHVEK